MDSISRRTFLGAVGAAAFIAATGKAIAIPPSPTGAAEHPSNDLLSGPWMMQSSAVATATGDQLSKEGADTAGWYSVKSPTTVMAGLIANGEYPDVFHGDNLKQVKADRFRVPWWYRVQFGIPPEAAGNQIWLYFKGINYRANIWLNGKQIADSKTAVGAYRDLELNITSAAMAGDSNFLAIEVIPPAKGDLAITFVDWAPKVPDQNMGIWQDVILRISGPVALRYPHILTDIDKTDGKVTVMADLVNTAGQAITGTLKAKIESLELSLEFSQDFTIPAGQTLTAALSQQTIPFARFWWPWQLGKPEMYDLAVSFTVEGRTSDQANLSFGVRTVTSRLERGHLLFTVNGHDLLIVGGGYAPDLFQRRDNQEKHIQYARDMNLNTIRLEGKLEDDAFFDLCDRAGMLVMAGWCCCSPWEQWKNWKAEQHAVASESLRYQIRKLRTHPSLLVWLNGSDNHPPADVETVYLGIEKELHWPCPTISSAAAGKSTVTGPSGVKMEGPYKWEPPIYWMTDTKKGGAWGFNTEVGPGAVPPPLETLEAMLPADHRWPIDDVWNYHCGGGTFATMKDFITALDARFGPSKGIADFAWKSQAQAYETIRAMYEGFRRNKFTATGEIQWMLNNAWPSMIWHLYDYYFRPGAAYFATKLACEPLHILYSYDNRSIAVANDTLTDFPNLTASADMYGVDGKVTHQQAAAVSSKANTSVIAFTLPAMIDVLVTTYFLRLTLTDSSGKVQSVNSYFLSTKPDVLDWEGGGDNDWNVTPCSSFADYTQLEKLPPVKLTLQPIISQPGDQKAMAEAIVTNSSSTIAVLVRLKLTRGEGGEEILPIQWSDNYFMLLPGEARQIQGRYLWSDAQGATPVFSVDCFNNGRA